jgi:P27 family predicted phage terminase small subunit
MPGPIKPPGKRINRITKDIGAVTAAGDAPRMPTGLCRQAQNAWKEYWSDAVSGVMRPSDTTLVLRWVTNLDRYHRLASEADRAPMVTGSTGQPKANPLYDLVFKVEASIREDERQLGIGPFNRLRLGVALSERAKTLADLNAEAQHANQDDDPRGTLSVVADRDA